MSQDPASPPPSTAAPTPLNYAPPPTGERADLRTIATRQRAIMFCILGYIILFVLQFAFPPPLRLVVGLAAFAMQIAGAVFVFMLALALYGTAAGVVLGILTLIPLIGLIVLLIINGKATNLLRAHGIHVGLMGARASEIPAPGQVPIR